jgi:hypothetical protein
VTILLRFRFDGEDKGWSIARPHLGPGADPESGSGSGSESESESDFEPEPEPEPAGFSRPEQVEFLRLVHDGLGRLMACSQLKLSERTLRRALARSPSFRHALEQVERMRAENLFSILYAAALRGDTHAARFLLSRHDRENRRLGPSN